MHYIPNLANVKISRTRLTRAFGWKFGLAVDV